MNGTGKHAPKRLRLSDCAKLLGQPRLLLWVQSKVGKFALPADTENGRPYWHEDHVYRWAATTYPRPIRHVPVRFWPDSARPATYYGAREIDDAVVQTWQADIGTVCVVWPLPGRFRRPPLRWVAAQLPNADTLICVQGDFGIDGPGLSTAQPDKLTQLGELTVSGQAADHWCVSGSVRVSHR